MKKKIVTPIIIGLVAIILIVVGIYFFAFYEKPGAIVNGYWNEATQECWISPQYAPGEAIPADILEDMMFATCCFNQVGNQIDCNDPSNILGGGLAQEIIAFGGADPVSGVFSMNNIITITNDIGSPIIDSAWISSAVWSPTKLDLSNAYAVVSGTGNSVGPLNPDTGTYWTTGTIDLTNIAGPVGSPNTYNLALTVDASAYGGELTTSKDFGTTLVVEAEAIGFSVDITWGEI